MYGYQPCYPGCKEIGFDIGSELKIEFQDLCSNMDLKKCPSNAWNPQSNAILEQIYQEVLVDGLVSSDLEGTHIYEDEDDPFDEYLTELLYTFRSSYHQSHSRSPAQLIFGKRQVLTSINRY